MDVVTTKQEFPPGWDEDKVKALADYYDRQTEEEAVAEDEEMLTAEDHTLMMIPVELVPVVRELIAEYEHKNKR